MSQSHILNLWGYPTTKAILIVQFSLTGLCTRLPGCHMFLSFILCVNFYVFQKIVLGLSIAFRKRLCPRQSRPPKIRWDASPSQLEPCCTWAQKSQTCPQTCSSVWIKIMDSKTGMMKMRLLIHSCKSECLSSWTGTGTHRVVIRGYLFLGCESPSSGSLLAVYYRVNSFPHTSSRSYFLLLRH